jgi:hypothetical protein
MGLVSAHRKMSIDRLRRRVAFEAAKLICAREETQYTRAKMKAARRLSCGEIQPGDLPGNREIRHCIRAIARSDLAEQKRLIAEVHADHAEGPPTAANEHTADRFRTYELLLLPLEHVMQPPESHPEGDVLYHSLQVFDLARQELPYDEELLLAALLHDVGKAIDRRDHVAAGLEALKGSISARTAWLIEHHVEAASWREGAIGVRLRRRLEASDDIDELMLLAQCDRRGRAVGAEAPDVWDALAYIRQLADACGD